MFLKTQTEISMDSSFNKVQKLKSALENADAVIIGAGAGLSAAAGFTYAGERFEQYFLDFEEKYGFKDMYAGGFYPYVTYEEHWAFWSRYIYINRYMDAPSDLYNNLYKLVKDKDYFVITTNVDHCFQKAGFDKKRLFYTQGDYGLFQCSAPCRRETFENKKIIREMLDFQGFAFDEKENLIIPEGRKIKMEISSSLIPLCPRCRKPITMNLRSDDTFVEDAGWDQAAERYSLFLNRHKEMNVLFLELGVGYNTPVIIKFPFWQMTSKNKNAIYCCINSENTAVPKEISSKSICINEDISEIINQLM